MMSTGTFTTLEGQAVVVSKDQFTAYAGSEGETTVFTMTSGESLRVKEDFDTVDEVFDPIANYSRSTQDWFKQRKDSRNG